MRTITSISTLILAATLLAGPAEARKGCPRPVLDHGIPVHLKPSAHTLSCGIRKLSSIEISKDAGLGRIELHGDLLAALQRDEGIVTLVDVADPENPQILGRFDNDAVDSLDGDLAFSADGDWLFYARQTDQFSQEGLHVLDISDPTNPTQAFYQPQGGASRIAYFQNGTGEWVFGLDAVAGFTVSLFEPATGALIPVHVDPLPALKVGGPASAGLEIVESDPVHDGVPTLYVTTGQTDLQIFDISNPMLPVMLSTVRKDPGGWAEIEVAGDSIYAATEYWFQTSNPPVIDVMSANRHGAQFYVTRSIDPLWRVQGMAATKRFLYVAYSHAGLVVFDLDGSIDANYQLFGSRNKMSRAPMAAPYTYDVEVDGTTVYVSDAATGTLTILSHT